MGHKGFSLIELLVVIAVVAILAAIIFPVFARVREQARRTACLSNLRQIGSAAEMYSEDWDGRFPYGGDPCDLNTKIWVNTPYVDRVLDMEPIQDVLNSYTHDPLIWRCPSDTGYEFCSAISLMPVGLVASPSAYQAFGDSYVYNTILALQPISLGNAIATDSHGVVHGPSDIVLFLDTTGAWHGGGLLGEERYNVLFVDGHAKNLDAEQEKAYSTMPVSAG